MYFNSSHWQLFFLAQVKETIVNQKAKESLEDIMETTRQPLLLLLLLLRPRMIGN